MLLIKRCRGEKKGDLKSVKKFVSLLLASLLLISVSGGTVHAYATADFSDVPVGNWAYESIMKMADAGVIEGTGNGTFSPGEKVSTAMFLTLIGRVAYEDNVKATTTAEDNWYSAYVRTAQSKGLLDGTSISDASVEGEVTRYDMATVIYAATKLLGVQDAVADTSQITDYGDIPNKYTAAVEQVYAQGLIKGDNKGNFNGADTMRRDEAAVVMVRLVAITAEKSKETGGNGEIIVDGIVIPPPPDTKPILERPAVMPEPGEYTAEYQAYLDNCGEEIVTKTVKFKMLDITEGTRILNTEMNIWREALGDEQHRMFVTAIKSDSKGEGSFTLDMPKSLYEKAMRDATGDLNSSPFIIFGGNAVWGTVIENGPAARVDATVNGVDYVAIGGELSNYYIKDNPMVMELVFYRARR